MGSTSDYRECVILNRAGEMRRGTVKYVRLMDQAHALRKLREDKAAWVSPEDAQAVLDAWRAEVTHAATLPAWATD